LLEVDAAQFRRRDRESTVGTGGRPAMKLWLHCLLRRPPRGTMSHSCRSRKRNVKPLAFRQRQPRMVVASLVVSSLTTSRSLVFILLILALLCGRAISGSSKPESSELTFAAANQSGSPDLGLPPIPRGSLHCANNCHYLRQPTEIRHFTPAKFGTGLASPIPGGANIRRLVRG
jgi:hypothetical protein